MNLGQTYDTVCDMSCKALENEELPLPTSLPTAYPRRSQTHPGRHCFIEADVSAMDDPGRTS